MKRHIVSVVVVLAAVAAASMTVSSLAAAQANASADAGPLKVLNTFKVGGPGGWDYLTVDLEARRLYVSHATRVMVLDADKGTPIGEIADTPGVHGIALVPEQNLGFTSNGKEGMLSVFDLKTLKTLRKIKAGRNPDSIIYDPASKKVLAFNGRSGDVTIVDPAALDKAPVSLPVGGKLETGVADGAGHVYVNVEDKNEIVAIDSKEGKVLAHWPIAPGEEPSGLALDREHHRLYSGCSNKLMVVLDAEQGKVLATVPVGSGVDGVAFDPQLGLAASANGRDGTLTAVKEGPVGTFTVVQTLKTANGARTITRDPKTHQFYLPCNVQTEFSVLVVGAAKP
ncbi:MAG: YncE family protein [Phycisphaerae bacterium]|nr:YncE family protein [Phycisphaerae bacterium]